MPGFLPVSLQNFLHGRQSGLRTQISGNNQPVKQLPVRAGAVFILHETGHCGSTIQLGKIKKATMTGS